MIGYFEIKDIDLAGRIGRLKTKGGLIETPYLFPVVDPIRQEVGLDTIHQMSFNAVITNAYLYYKRMLQRGVKEAPDIHEYLGWSGVVMTDSGGYQVLEYGGIDIDNKTIVNFQKDIGVDIGVILDIPTGSTMTYSQAYNAVNETYKRALEALPLIQDSNVLWVFPIQGSPYKDLLFLSSLRAWRLPYHIYALGSPTVLLERYDYVSIVELVALARSLLPPHKPLHVFGVGHPMIIPFLVALGADLFDSASYILYARDQRYMVENGTKKLSELEYFPCNCPICSRYTPKELLSLNKSEQTKMLAIHNLYVLRRELNRVKQAIREGRLWELIEERSRGHPSLYSAFQVIKKYSNRLLRKFTPLTKGSAHALLVYGVDSLYNPKIIEFKGRVSKFIKSRYKEAVLLPAVKKPYRLQQFINNIRRTLSGEYLFYNLFLGVIPWDLAETYPVFQHEEPALLPEDDERALVNSLVKDIIGFLGTRRYEKVVVVGLTEYPWTLQVIKMLKDHLRNCAETSGDVITVTCTLDAGARQPQPRKPF